MSISKFILVYILVLTSVVLSAKTGEKTIKRNRGQLTACTNCEDAINPELMTFVRQDCGLLEADRKGKCKMYPELSIKLVEKNDVNEKKKSE